ncbi:hypothetical protein N0V88_003213 [Collariella sp. IMI 366227]|nr:hypothetical protein N0V88_003213 [Collariella sp. IMI 366227]
MSETEQPTKTYRGNCQCGAFVFELEAPEIKTTSNCTCSICSKRAYLWVMPSKPLKIIKDDGKLVHYSFGAKNMDHQLRTLQDVDIRSLEVITLDGKSYDPQYVAAKYLGAEPNPPGFENGKTYHGSCHCGAVTAAIKINGSLEDGAYDESVGDAWISSAENQFAIQGSEKIAYYVFGNHIWRKSFCQTCGVNIATGPDPNTSAEEIAELSEEAQQFRETMRNKRLFNTRVLDAFDVKSLKSTKGDGVAGVEAGTM